MNSRKSPIDSSYCCSMSWISSWNTPATTTAIAPGRSRDAPTGGTGTQRRAEQAGDRAAADQDADPGGEAEFQRQHVEQRQATAR